MVVFVEHVKAHKSGEYASWERLHVNGWCGKPLDQSPVPAIVKYGAERQYERFMA